MCGAEESDKEEMFEHGLSARKPCKPYKDFNQVLCLSEHVSSHSVEAQVILKGRVRGLKALSEMPFACAAECLSGR